MKTHPGPLIVIVVFAVLVAAAIIFRSWVWGGVALFLAALLLNGFIATLEDDLADDGAKGDGIVSPRYVRVVAWTVRGIGTAAVIATVWIVWLAKSSQGA